MIFYVGVGVVGVGVVLVGVGVGVGVETGGDYSYRYCAYIALSLMTINHLEGETIISRKASGWSISYIARVLVYLTERTMVWLRRCYYFSRQRVSSIIINCSKSYVHRFISLGRNLLILCFWWMIFCCWCWCWCWWCCHFRYCCKTKDYRANVSFALAAYLIYRNRIIGTWVQV